MNRSFRVLSFAFIFAAGAISMAIWMKYFSEPKVGSSRTEYHVKAGVVALEEDVQIVAASDSNTLILRDGKWWTGDSRKTEQIVIVINGEVITSTQVPKDFRLADSYLIEFEPEEIAFLNLGTNERGFVRRSSQSKDFNPTLWRTVAK